MNSRSLVHLQVLNSVWCTILKLVHHKTSLRSIRVYHIETCWKHSTIPSSFKIFLLLFLVIEELSKLGYGPSYCLKFSLLLGLYAWNEKQMKKPKLCFNIKLMENDICYKTMYKELLTNGDVMMSGSLFIYLWVNVYFDFWSCVCASL